MDGTPQTIKKHCPVCGQRLAITVRSLERTVQCPRCQTEHIVGMFIARNETLHAVEPPQNPAAFPPTTSPASVSRLAPEPVPLAAPLPAPDINDTVPESALPPLVPAPTVGPFPPRAEVPTPTTAAASPPIAGPFTPKGAPDGPGFVTSGMQVAGAGLNAAKVSTSFLLSVADQADLLLSGRRLHALGLTAIAGVLTHYFGEGSGSVKDWAWVANLSFVGVVALALLAFVARCRADGTGPFSTRLAVEQLGALGAVASEVLADLGAAPWGLRFQHLGAAAAFAGIVGAEALILANEVTDDHAGGARPLAALWVASIGLVLAWWGRTLQAPLVEVSTAPSAVAEPGGAQGLPLLVDTGAPMPPTAMPLVDEVLGVLGAWRPGRQSYERAYHARLHGALRRKLAGVAVESEARRTDRYGKWRRVDLILSRGAESLLVEVKSSSTTGALDRATTQVWDYAALNIGPVLVVLCGASSEEPTVRRLVDHVGEQRSLGLAIGVVVAAVRGAPAAIVGGPPPGVVSRIASAASRPSGGRGLPHLVTAATVSMFFAWQVERAPASEETPPAAPQLQSSQPPPQPPHPQPVPPLSNLPCETAHTCIDCATRIPCGWCGAWGRCVRLVADPANCNGVEARACGVGWACNHQECPTGR